MVSRILQAGYSQDITREVLVALMDNLKPSRKILKQVQPCYPRLLNLSKSKLITIREPWHRHLQTTSPSIIKLTPVILMRLSKVSNNSQKFTSLWRLEQANSSCYQLQLETLLYLRREDRLAMALKLVSSCKLLMKSQLNHNLRYRTSLSRLLIKLQIITKLPLPQLLQLLRAQPQRVEKMGR